MKLYLILTSFNDETGVSDEEEAEFFLKKETKKGCFHVQVSTLRFMFESGAELTRYLTLSNPPSPPSDLRCSV